jgi:hypothetical protein
MTVRSAILALGPTVYWPLDDPTGPSASDASGGGHPGLYYGAFQLNQPGPESGTLSTFFYNNTGNVLLLNQPFGNVFPWSMSVYMAVSAFPPNAQAFLYWADFNARGMGYTVTNGGVVNNVLGVNRYGVGQLLAGFLIPDNDWHLYTMVQGRTSPAVLWELYRDSTLILSNASGYNANAAGIGLMGVGGLSAYVAHFAFYSSALTLAQVGTLATSRVGPASAPSAIGVSPTGSDATLAAILASVRKIY